MSAAHTAAAPMEDTAATLPELPGSVAIMPLRGLVVFPLTTTPLNVGQPRSIRLVDQIEQNGRFVGLFSSRDPELESPGPEQLHHTGTVATIRRSLRAADGTIRLLVDGVHRIRLADVDTLSPYIKARVVPAVETSGNAAALAAGEREVRRLFAQLAERVPGIPGDLILPVLQRAEPARLAYTVANYLGLEVAEAQAFLEIDTWEEKLGWLVGHVQRELEFLALGQKIRTEAHGRLERSQRAFFLREQAKAIQRELSELGEEGSDQSLIVELRQRLEAARLPDDARREAEREIARLEMIPPASPEYSVSRGYLEWLLTIPWQTVTTDKLDLHHARAILDEDHYALADVKQRILEMLAVRKLRSERGVDGAREGAILALVGPPGVGKSSLGRSIARALGRRFIRVALGGLRDVAEIRGHRRTYVGAMPGRIMQALQRAGSANPVILLDEIDKIGGDVRGDPAAALLEVLDPAQNRAFRDQYLGVPFDLSRVIFLATANHLATLPGPLRDRMEVLTLSGYTEAEKLTIARTFLYPRLLQDTGLRPDELQLSDDLLRALIRDYTNEAGVRDLERRLATIGRHVAMRVAAGEWDTRLLAAGELAGHLGPPLHYREGAAGATPPGVATGLAWTGTGGRVIVVEVAKMPGARALTITGHLGDVMRESAATALSLVRSRAAELGIAADFFDRHDLHIHVPAGAVAKDGPSAGAVIVAALASLATGRSVAPGVALTGEITLRGRLLPVGGVKEKVLAAHRAGVHTVYLPRANEADLAAIPAEVKTAVALCLVDDIADLLAAVITTADPVLDDTN